MTYLSTVKTSYIDSQDIDAFGKLRISDNNCIFSSKMFYDNQPLIWDDQQTTGGGTSSTFNTNQACVTMAVSASTAGKRVRRTYRAFNYQAAKSHLIYMSGTFGTAASGITKNIGYFDNNNGLMFRQTTVMNIVSRTGTSGSPVETIVAQSAWNVDKLDGTGASGLTVDFTKAQIFVIDFEWLGAGRIRFGIVLNGQIYYCHYIANLNTLTIPWAGIPSLPITYDIENSGSGVASSLIQISSSVISEGNNNQIGYIKSVNRLSTTVSVSGGNFSPVLSIRLQSGKTSSTIIPLEASIRSDATSISLFQLFLNPTIAGVDAASWVNLANSNIQYDVSRTSANSVTGGTVLYSSYINDNQSFSLNQLESMINLGVSIAGTSDQLVLGCLSISVATGYLGSLTFKELT